MLRQRLIPSLLLKEGRLVKGVAFADWRDAGRPDTTIRAHSAQGADEMLLLDIEASRHGRGPDIANLRAAAKECRVPLTFGGGIRSLDDARACFAAGADKLCLTTTALDQPSLITTLSRIFGSQAIVLGLDVVEVSSGIRLFDFRSRQAIDKDVFAWIAEGVQRGAGELKVTVVNREGARAGMAIGLVADLLRQVSVPVIVEGGAGSLPDLDEAFAAGVDGVAVGTMLVFSDNNLVKLKRYLAMRGRNVRT